MRRLSASHVYAVALKLSSVSVVSRRVRIVGERLVDRLQEHVDLRPDLECALVLREAARQVVGPAHGVALCVGAEGQVRAAVVFVGRGQDVERVQPVDLASRGHAVQDVVVELGDERLARTAVGICVSEITVTLPFASSV